MQIIHTTHLQKGMLVFFPSNIWFVCSSDEEKLSLRFVKSTTSLKFVKPVSGIPLIAIAYHNGEKINGT